MGLLHYALYEHDRNIYGKLWLAIRRAGHAAGNGVLHNHEGLGVNHQQDALRRRFHRRRPRLFLQESPLPEEPDSGSFRSKLNLLAINRKKYVRRTTYRHSHR